MDRDQYTDESYFTPHVPPTTAPAIDPNAEPLDAAELARDDGDSDASGSHEASVNRADKDADIAPGKTPDEIVPDEGDITEPTAPSEIEIEREDVDMPGQGPDEVEPQPDDTDMPVNMAGGTLPAPD